MAGHLFISYSRQDAGYVQSLVSFLGSAGFEVWTDEGIEHGDRWAETIRGRIDECAAFIPVMTLAAEQSTWVEREIARAEEQRRPILPLLLSGLPFFRLSNVQYDDVTGGRMPGQRYVDRLSAVLGRPATAPAPDGATVHRPPGVSEPKSTSPSAERSMVAVGAAIGVLGLAIYLIVQWRTAFAVDVEGNQLSFLAMMDILTFPLAAGVAAVGSLLCRQWTFALSAFTPTLVVLSLLALTSSDNADSVGGLSVVGGLAAVLTAAALAANDYRGRRGLMNRLPAALGVVGLVAIPAALLVDYAGEEFDWAFLTLVFAQYAAAMVLLVQSSWEPNDQARWVAAATIVAFAAFTLPNQIRSVSGEEGSDYSGYLILAALLFAAGLVTVRARVSGRRS